MALDPNTWTHKTQEAVNAALTSAREHSNPEATPDHLLAALKEVPPDTIDYCREFIRFFHLIHQVFLFVLFELFNLIINISNPRVIGK